jgi:hypothetical protein
MERQIAERGAVEESQTPGAPTPAPDAPPSGPSGQSFKLQLPSFDAFKAREGRPRIRHANDPEMLQADIGDVHAVAKYAGQAAMTAAIQVANVSGQMQGRAFDAKLAELARVFDQTLQNALTAGINDYDEWRKAQAWYRRLWKWIRERVERTPSPTPAESP